MDVKHSTLSAMQSALGQAHVDPEKGRQGEFKHWQRIFDANDRPHAGERPLLTPATDGGDLCRPADRTALRQADDGRSASHSARAGTSGQPGLGVAPAKLATHPLARDRVIGGMPMPAPTSTVADARPTAASLERVSAWPTAQASRPVGGTLTPDGRPLAQLEAHLSRGADGRLNVALRSSQPLSTAQALHAVAQALAAQDGQAPVDQVLLNGQPIYRSAQPAGHRFEIDC